jgi:hypothetical protein
MAEEKKGVRKGKRVPLKIYKLKIDTVDKLLNTDLIISANEYLLNKDMEDTYTDEDNIKVIKVTVDDVPAGGFSDFFIRSLPSTFQVTEDDQGNNYIGIEGKKLYIYTSTFQNIISREHQLVFEFYLNPANFTPDYKKLITEMRTRGGWEIQHWGQALTEIRVTGRSGAMIKKIENGQIVPLTDNDLVEDSIAWKKLTELSSLYTNDHLLKNKPVEYLLGLSVYDSFYIGYFTSFTGPILEDAQPYIVGYSFGFKAQSVIKLNNTQLLENQEEYIND